MSDGTLRALAVVLVLVLASAGCVRRTVSITSSPPGALVWINDREVGRTPLDVEFVHDGVYDVRLAAEGYEPLVTSGSTSPPVWDLPPFDLGAELAPATLERHVSWHYELEPADLEPQGLLERAREARVRTADGVEGP
jgi:hypothetical protein